MRVMQVLDAILVVIILVPLPCHVLDIRPGSSGERGNEFCFSTRSSHDMRHYVVLCPERQLSCTAERGAKGSTWTWVLCCDVW